MSDISYDRDFYEWTDVQAAALRAKAWNQLDWDNLAEEIESLGKSDRRAVQSHLKVLLRHLLKCAYQPPPHASWRTSIKNARDEIELILDDSPSLRRHLPPAVAWAYPRARDEAADETALALAIFPETCPWPLDRILNPSFFPEETVAN
jgi:Domain of unknown function DUF29